MSDPDGELEALRARVARLEAKGPARSRRRPLSLLAVLLVLVAAVLTPLSVVSVWARDEIGDTDRYVGAVAPLASDPAVRAAVSDRVTDAVAERLDIEALLSQITPADRPAVERALRLLSGPLTDGVSALVHGTVERFVSSAAFATLWTELNRSAHGAVVKALTGEGGGAVKLSGDTVSIDLAPVIERVKQLLVDQGLTIAAKVPEIHTDYTVLTSDSVGKAKRGFRLLQLAGFWLPVVTLVLVGCAVLCAVRRRRALVTAALGVAVGAAVLGVALGAGRAFYLDSLPAEGSQPAAGAVFDALAGSLRTAVRFVVTLGVVVALAAWLTGTGRAAYKVRVMWTSGIGAAREAAGVGPGPVGTWVHRRKPVLNWAVVGAAVAVLLVWDRPTGLVTWWTALAALLALAVVEFLDTEAETDADADVGTGARVSG